jgi:hypothetical protein
MSNTLEVALEGLVPSLSQQIAVNGTTDKLLLVTSGGDAKYVIPARLAQITSIDPVPIDSTPGTINTTTSDSVVIPISGTGTVITVTADEGIEGVLEFLSDGGTLEHSASLLLPGSNDIVWAAGDRAYYEGQSGAVTNISRFERKSGVPVNKGVEFVRTVSLTNITIATALNVGDSLNGLTLVLGEPILVAGQTAKEQNGIYTVGPSPARTTNYDHFEAFVGLEVYEAPDAFDVTAQWVCTTLTGGTIDTDDLDFTKSLGTIGRQDADALTGTFTDGGLQIDADTGTGTMAIRNGDTIVGATVETLTIKTNGGDKELSLLGDAIVGPRPVTAKTGNYSVLIADEHTIFTNTGAGGTVKFTLPANAGCTEGYTKFRFVRLAAQDLQVEPASGNIYGYNDAQSTAINATNGAPVAAVTTIGEWIEVTYLGSNIWTTECNGRWS